MKDLIIRYAEKEELDAVNRIRKQVNDIHKAGRPDIFRAGYRIVYVVTAALVAIGFAMTLVRMMRRK